jgi:DNA polymerase-4
MQRTILHFDLDAFFCAVEELHNPALSGVPFAVGGKPDERGVVSSCSYPARRYGVRSAMPMARARRICPDLIILPPRFREYSRISRIVMEKLHQVSPVVEQVSIDEAFIDISLLPDSVETTAHDLQRKINQDVGLPCSLGVASNKLLAKIANDVGKSTGVSGSPPNAITIVPPGEEKEFLKPLKVERLWGVGPKTASRLSELGVSTIGELAAISETRLVKLFGKNGHWLYLHAQGIDESPLVTSHEMKSVSSETTFVHDIKDIEILHKTLRDLAEQVGKRLRDQNLSGTTIRIKIRWSDFTTISRQSKLASSIEQDADIYKTAEHLFDGTWEYGRAVRLLGVGVSGLEKGIRQLNLWEARSEAPDLKARQLQTAIDGLRERYGAGIVRRGNDVEEKHST